MFAKKIRERLKRKNDSENDGIFGQLFDIKKCHPVFDKYSRWMKWNEQILIKPINAKIKKKIYIYENSGQVSNRSETRIEKIKYRKKKKHNWRMIRSNEYHISQNCQHEKKIRKINRLLYFWKNCYANNIKKIKIINLCWSNR